VEEGKNLKKNSLYFLLMKRKEKKKKARKAHISITFPKVLHKTSFQDRQTKEDWNHQHFPKHIRLSVRNKNP
jgi:predicted DNA-binding transcriptional regulator AlpA